ncbi:transcription factor TFIIIB component B'' homolog isoform X2 [Pseudophryne corroboree]|uniref:transcription factor TFIIIB component B'' homolog isoform X2 n=1 Tax=Pseudophryne corroboree TaxID=495146 RepID=UPI0030813FF8
MIRRARLSFKPNVRPGSRAPGSGAVGGGDGVGAPQPEPVHVTGKDNVRGGLEESATQGSAETQPRESEAERHEKTTTVSNESQPSVATSTPLQRRKRISTLPNLAKPRLSNSKPVVVAPPPKPPQVEIGPTLPVSNVPCQTEVSPPEKAKLPSPPKSQAPPAATQAQHVALPEKRTPVPQVPQFSPYKKSVLKHSEASPVKPVECTPRDELSPLKERPSQKSINEDFVTNKRITSKKTVGNLEKERLRRSQKLRELLRDELRKERKIWKEKHPIIPITVEPERSKMVMRDFIHFIPANNPMTSSLEETKTSEKSPPTESQVTQGPVGKTSNVDEEDPDEEEGGEDDDSQLLAPRVKVAEDGSIILDEESLTVEVIRNKAPIVEGNDPIFERGSTTTYSSFRKSNYSKPWSDQETDMFFLAISMVGTDFSMIGQLFPHRERIEIKNKFKREERANGWRIDKAFREKKSFDFEFFAQLLEKALEAGKKKPKTPRTKQPREKKANKSRKKQKDKSAAEHNDGESASLSEGERADARSAEKENEGSRSVKECSPAPDPVPGKKRRARKKKGDINEPEEENPETQGGDLPQIPKKKESQKKSKKPAESKERNTEHESTTNDKSLEDVKTEKKRGRKKKSAPKESEVEEGENDGTDKLQDSRKNKYIANESCDVPEDTEDDANAFSETAEVDLSSESVTLPIDEDSSLVLFTEESECHSGLDELSSMQDSQSQDQQPEAQIADATKNTTFGDSGSMEASQEQTSPSAIDRKSNTSAKESSAEDVEVVEQDLEPKDKQQVLRGRCKRPVPNLSKASVKKEVSTGKPGDKERQIGPCEHLEIAVGDEKTPEEDAMTVDKHTEPSVKSEESMSPNAYKESSKQSAPRVRGRFQRPKPNVQIKASSKREKMDDNEDIPVEIKEQSTDVSSVISQSHKEDIAASAELDNEEMEVSSVDESHRQVSSAPVPVPCPIQKDFGSEAPLAQPVGSDAASLDSGTLDVNKEKPLPGRGRLLRPKPNLTKIPAKIKPCVSEQDIQHASQSQDTAQPSCTDTISPSRAAARDQKTKFEEKSEPPSCSQEERRTFPIKPAILSRSRSQRPNPSVLKLSAEMEKSDVECAGDPSANDSDLPSSLQNNIHSGNQGTGMSLHENGVSTSAQDSSPSREVSCSDPLSSLKLIKDNDSFPGVGTMGQKPLTESVSQTECKKSPIKPNLLTRGRLGRPKPNLLKASGRKGVSEVGEDKSIRAASDENANEKISLDSNEKISLDSNEKISLDSNEKISLDSNEKISLDSNEKISLDSNEKISLDSNEKISLDSNEKISLDSNEKISLDSNEKISLDSNEKISLDSNEKISLDSNEKISLDSNEKISLDSNEKISLDSDDELSILGNSAELVNEVLSGESGAQEESCLRPSDSEHSLKGDLESKGSDKLTEELQKPLKPAVLTRGRFQRPKPNLCRAVTKRDALTSPNLPKSPPKGETCVEKVLEPDAATTTLSVCEVEKVPVLAKSNIEEPVPPVIQSSTTLLETLHSQHSVPATGRADTEEPATPSKDYSARVIMNNERRDSVDERDAESSKPILKTGRFQRPKPNLSRAATRIRMATVPEETSTGEKLGAGTSSINESPIGSRDVEISAGDVERESCAVGCQSAQLCEENTLGSLKENTQAVQLDEVAHTGEQVEGSSVKPVRGRFQKARPNIGRAAVRREMPAINQRTLASEQDEVKLEVSGKVADPQQSEEVTDAPLTSHGTSEARQANEKKSTAIKPAQLRRFKHVKPVPSLVTPSKRPSLSESKRSDEETAPHVPTTKDPAIEVHVSSPANKRKASECNEDVPKRSRLSDKSCRPSYLSDSEVDHVSLPNKPESSCQSADVQEQSNPQQSRFGRTLRKTLSTTLPVLPKPSENSSQRPDNGKTRQRVKPNKSKVSKPSSNKSKGKTTLVKLRATQREDEEEEDAELDFEEEDYNLAPDMLNQAPVFVPFSLRSPKYVPAEIEETLEEFEIPVEDEDVLSNASLESGNSPSQTLEHAGTQAPPADTDHCYGSTEAAMTLISMGNSASQSSIGESLSSDHCAEKELPPTPRSQKDLEQYRRFESLSSSITEHLSNNKHSVCAAENSTLNARSVDDHHDLPSSAAEHGSLPRPETTQSDDLMISPAFHSSEDSLHAFSDNLVMPVDQRYRSMQEGEPQHDLMSEVSDSLLDSGCPAEEETFILTLVEIPINEDYAYSCDSNSTDSLPAPVIISSGSSQTLTQNQSSGYPVPVESVSCEPPMGVQEELMCSQSSRKRTASGSIGADGTIKEKKIVLCESVQQAEDKMKAAAAETDCNKRSTYEASPAEPEHTMEFTQTEDFPVGGENLPCCTKQSDSVHIDKSATGSTELLNTNLPSACAKTASTSKAPLKRPGSKPLGFLPLVCKDKQSKKAKKETSKKKNLAKHKKIPTPASRPQQHSHVLSQEDATSNTVPSQCTVASAVTPSSETEEIITPECQVSDNQTTESQEPSNDLATEEEAAPVSEYFFSDIFMEIDD